MDDPLVDAWRHINGSDDKSWVLFEHGTCVILMEPEDDLAWQAGAILRDWRPAGAGPPFDQFSVVELTDYPGWVVTCYHPDILTYVAPEALDAAASSPSAASVPADLIVGGISVLLRDADARELVVIHVEDKRPSR